MFDRDKTASSAEILTLAELTSALAAAPQRPVLFQAEGRRIRPGYHVTEVKAGAFSALDCGGNPALWSEMIVQLLDGEGDGEGAMTAGKLIAILDRVADHVRLDGSAQLTFEVSDGRDPIRLFSGATVTRIGDGLVVDLQPRPAQCKPEHRRRREGLAPAACTGQKAGAPACCS
ncbi:DUF6428 family protein [Rhizobium sp. YIM 134829]|uniref:DUF6428 family protein n=1 Tax=Rhizobium sp. YIM 134829 TaxID=3390453 RepID=UPI00397E7CFB